MKPKKVTKNHNVPFTIDKKFLKYPFFQNAKRVRVDGKRIRKGLIYFKVKDLIDDGITSTSDLARTLGKSRRQIRRYLINMSLMQMIRD